MTKVRVLISDPMSSQAVNVFEQRGIEVVQTGKMTEDELLEMIPEFDGLAIRSATKVTQRVLDAATRLKVVGRAGIGVDNVDVPACTAKGIVVMNTPMGNAITTAEHALAMMFSLARHIPQANQTTHAGAWAKSKYMGVELTGKLLGVIGSGNIGSIVAQKALGFGMKVQAYDPYLTEERANALGIKKVELEELLTTSDIITLHVPKTSETENIISASAINKMKKGALLINCARGGLVDELALRVALESGHLMGAALDVFLEEPAKENPLFGLENVICTPHLGASTTEAQEKVAVQIAEQISDYLLEASVTNALNAPNLSADEARQLAPYLQLVNYLGAFAGQLTHTAIKGLTVTFAGDAAGLNVEPLTTQVVQSVLAPHFSNINVVNARDVARDRGIHIVVAKEDLEDIYHNRVTISIETGDKSRSVSGTLIQNRPRLVDIKGIKLESEFGQHMLYITNQDEPGMIGAIGNFAADRSINIANMHLGRRESRGDAISLLEIDAPVNADDLEALRSIKHIHSAQYLNMVPLML
ncbi:MAG: D-3-phosphoglycerate dehydrogenase [marine bacterium B5-7]|nr:MAG: D-3-phosphoglycerate dehydrogenase [marine bacterium B5-7]